MAKNRPIGVTIWLAKLLNLNSPIWISLLNTHLAIRHLTFPQNLTKPLKVCQWCTLTEHCCQWRPLEESHLWVNSESQWAHFEMLYRRLLVDSSRFNLWIGHAALLKCICNSSKFGQIKQHKVNFIRENPKKLEITNICNITLCITCAGSVLPSVLPLCITLFHCFRYFTPSRSSCHPPGLFGLENRQKHFEMQLIFRGLEEASATKSLKI